MIRSAAQPVFVVCVIVGAAVGVALGVVFGWGDPTESVAGRLKLVAVLAGGGIVAGGLIAGLFYVLVYPMESPKVPTDGPEADYHDLVRTSPPSVD